MITISEERYSELLRAECVYNLMAHVIAEKVDTYSSISYQEVQIYDLLFCGREKEETV